MGDTARKGAVCISCKKREIECYCSKMAITLSEWLKEIKESDRDLKNEVD